MHSRVFDGVSSKVKDWAVGDSWVAWGSREFWPDQCRVVAVWDSIFFVF